MPSKNKGLVSLSQIRNVVNHNHKGNIGGDALSLSHDLFVSTVNELMKPLPTILKEWKRKIITLDMLKVAHVNKKSLKVIASIEPPKKKKKPTVKSNRGRKKKVVVEEVEQAQRQQ